MHSRSHSVIAARAVVVIVLATAAAVMLPVDSARGQSPPHKEKIPVSQAAGPNSVSQDFGNIAVVVDNGLMVTSRNLFDLTGVAVQFTPAGSDAFSVASAPASLDPVFGPTLTFGYPGATLWPGDDDTQEVPFPAGFPFFGTLYTSVWVNTDGNVTFGAPEFATDDKDRSKVVLGPPRISAYLMDVNPFNAFNPFGIGTIHAAVKTAPNRLVVTWNEVGDFQAEDGSSTFQITLYSSGVASIAIDHINPGAVIGVTGIAEGGGAGPFHNVDLAGSTPITPAGAIMEAFAPYTQISLVQITREFYKTHPDKFDSLIAFSEFPVDSGPFSRRVSNQTHGLRLGMYDNGAVWGSAGELEHVGFLLNIPELIYPVDPVNPPVVPYDPSLNIVQVGSSSGWPVTLDGQTMSQVRRGSTLLPDDGEFSRFFPNPHGTFYTWLDSAMEVIAHEIEHRWGVYVRFVHPVYGADGIPSFDLLGRDLQHWSYFANVTVPPSQFGGVPRCSVMEGNSIVDLGPLANYNGTPTNLAPGERVFATPPDQLMDGYTELDQYLMGIRKANEVSPFWYVDDPKSIYTGQSLDVINPINPTSTIDTMRGWRSQGGIVFKGKRVDLTLDDIKDFEKIREGGANPHGKRFWGPKNNLTVNYFSANGHVDPAGDASVVLSASERELGDEADLIDAQGKPVDVKTMAFILVVKNGQPSSYLSAINRLDEYRQLWEAYGNGPASNGRGKFDTRLNPPVY